MINQEKRRNVLGEINMNCENQLGGSLLSNSKQFQIPKLIKKKSNKTKSIDELWKQLKLIIEKNVEDSHQKDQAFEIITILQERDKTIPTGNSPKIEATISSNIFSNNAFLECLKSEPIGIDCSEKIISQNLPDSSSIEPPGKNLSQDALLISSPVATERAKRRHRRASLCAAFESPTKVQKQQEPCVQEETQKIIEPSSNSITPNIEKDIIHPEFPEEIDGLVHWIPESCATKIHACESNNADEVISTCDKVSECQEQIEKMTIVNTTDLLVDEMTENVAPQKSRRGRRKSVCAAKFQATKSSRKKMNSPRNSDEELKIINEISESNVLESSPPDILDSQDFDDFNTGFLHWAGDTTPLITDEPHLQQVETEILDVMDLSRSKRRQRRVSISAIESPKKARKPKALKGTQKYYEELSEPTFVTPQKDKKLTSNLDEEEVQLSDTLLSSRIVEILPQHLVDVTDLLKMHHNIGSSPGEIIVSVCLASVLIEKSKDSISCFIEYFLPLFRSFSRLSTDNSIFTSFNAQQKLRKIRFGDTLGSSCFSPPNDRKPGSCQKFQENSHLYANMLSSIEILLKTERDSTEFKCLMDRIRVELQHLSHNKKVTLQILEIYAKSQSISLDAFTLPSSHDLSQISSFLLAELDLREIHNATENTKDTNEKNLYTLPVHPLYLPQNTLIRTTLRHKSTWTTVSVIRYHLRWLLDEPPLRAEKVQLIGSTPMQSSRSFLTQLMTISPFQSSNTNRAECMDISASSALTLAIQQLYNGLGVWFTLQEYPSTISIDALYDALTQSVQQFQHKVTSLLTDDTLSPREVLQFAQVISYFT